MWSQVVQFGTEIQPLLYLLTLGLAAWSLRLLSRRTSAFEKQALISERKFDSDLALDGYAKAIDYLDIEKNESQRLIAASLLYSIQKQNANHIEPIRSIFISFLKIYSKSDLRASQEDIINTSRFQRRDESIQVALDGALFQPTKSGQSESPFASVDLKYCVLRSVSFFRSYGVLENVNLSQAKLYNCNFSNGTMRNLIAERAVIKGGSFKNTDFHGCRFIGTILEEIEFTRCRFEECIFAPSSGSVVFNRCFIDVSTQFHAGSYDLKVDEKLAPPKTRKDLKFSSLERPSQHSGAWEVIAP